MIYFNMHTCKGCWQSKFSFVIVLGRFPGIWKLLWFQNCLIFFIYGGKQSRLCGFFHWETGVFWINDWDINLTAGGKVVSMVEHSFFPHRKLCSTGMSWCQYQPTSPGVPECSKAHLARPTCNHVSSHLSMCHDAERKPGRYYFSSTCPFFIMW